MPKKIKDNNSDFKVQLKQKKLELARLILEKNAGRLKNTRAAFTLRKEIARLITKNAA